VCNNNTEKYTIIMVEKFLIADWTKIKISFENEDFVRKQIICFDINIVMSKYKNQDQDELLLSLSCFSNNINHMINNLPDNIDILLVETYSHILKEISNLPYGIKELKIIYKDISKNNIKHFINSNAFNILFNIKLPFTTKIIAKLCNIEYDVFILDNENIKISTEYDVFTIHKIQSNTQLLWRKRF